MTLLGSGDAAGVPVYGCECAACARARRDPAFQRKAPCAIIETSRSRLLIDAGITDLVARMHAIPPTGILLTHFHVDHVEGLFPLRWGRGAPITVWCPPDPEGCADLFKHPGLLRFKPVILFEEFQVEDLFITPVPLIHSKLTYGYLVRKGQEKIAYLTDTIGLPKVTLDYLIQRSVDVVVLDCAYPPGISGSNHNNLDGALSLAVALGGKLTIFTHIGHELDCWRLQSTPERANSPIFGSDGLEVGAIKR